MKEQQLAEELLREGFVHLYVWEDGPDVEYPDHTHRSESAHFILSGQMSMTMNGETHVYHEGDRCDLPAGAVHSAKIGPTGCRYLVAER